MDNGQIRPPKSDRLRRVIAVGLLGACLVGMWWFLPRPEPVIRELPQAVATDPNLEPLSLKLLDSPRVSRKRALYPHGGPTFGEDEYRYRGFIEIDGRRVRLRVETYEPITAVRFKNEVYLVLRAYFWDEYCFRKLDASDNFVEVSYRVLDPAFGYLQFTDGLVSFRYRVWWMSALANDGKAGQVVACFNGYTTQDPRWVFPEEKKGTQLEDFLESIWENGSYYGLVDSLRTIITHSTATDEEQTLRFVCRTLMRLSPEEGTRFVCEFEQELRAKPVVGSDRRLEAFQLLRPCDEPTTSAPS